MSHRAYLRRCSISETNLNSEMKSWRRNKMEDRKLAQKHDTVDKHMANRRKSVHFEKQQLNKELEENVMKRTPSLEEYLDRSQNKYLTWKEREKERLDRRYRSLHKAYMKEYKDLGLHNFIPTVDPSERPTAESNEPTEADNSVETGDGKVKFDNDEKMSEEEALLELGKFSLEANQRRFSEFGGTASKYHGRRRGSTGSIDLDAFMRLRSVHVALTTVAEDIDAPNENDKDALKDRRNPNEITEQGRYKSANSVDESDIAADDLIVKPKRRASIAILPDKPYVTDQLPIGKRLDRRPTLPNVAIPINYGN